MRILLFCALALTALVSTPALAGDPETCAYRETRLAQACRTNPDIREWLLEPAQAGVERYVDVPPIIRGWDPGEEAAVIAGIARLQAEQSVGCDYNDVMLARACMIDPVVARTLRTVGRGHHSSWFVLPPEVGGYPGSRFNEAILSRTSGANQQRFAWGSDVSNRYQRAYTLERTIGRAMRAEVSIAKVHLIAVDGINFVACGYLFSNGGGYEAPSGGTFLFDTRGGSIYRVPPETYRARCLAADAVLK